MIIFDSIDQIYDIIYINVVESHELCIVHTLKYNSIQNTYVHTFYVVLHARSRAGVRLRIDVELKRTEIINIVIIEYTRCECERIVW